MASTQVELDEQLQNGTAATLNNHTKAEMQLIKSHSWSGDFNSSLPETIPSDGGVARFDHLNGIEGSKAALCYTITNTAGATYAVVLAWSAPANFNSAASPSKVYGAIASRCIIDIITWDQIQMLLDKSEASVESIIEEVGVEATILNNPTTKMADLVVNFQLRPINHDDDTSGNNDNNNKDDDDNDVDKSNDN